jgi:hypothetical protein
MAKAFADKLIDMCEHHAGQMAEQWYQSLIANPRTNSFNAIAKESCQRHAIYIYKHLGQMYFAENCYQAVAHHLDVSGFVEDHFARGIRLEEVIYALIIMRRQIWLHSEQEALYNIPEDMYELVQSTNRILLVFDYAFYIVISRYADIGEAARIRFKEK